MLILAALVLQSRPVEIVHRFKGPMPTGVTVSAAGRVFVNFPRWGDTVPSSVVELKNGREIPFPNREINRDDKRHAATHFICVQSVVVDPRDRLWVLDAGAPKLGLTIPNGPKLVCIDLQTNKVTKWIRFPKDVAKRTTYLNDVRFDLRKGAAGRAFITDSTDKGPNGIIVVDLATGKSWRRLNDHRTTKADPTFVPTVEGKPLKVRLPGQTPQKLKIGSDSIALSADGDRLYYSPLISRRLYSVDMEALANPSVSEAAVSRTVRDEGLKGASDGILGSTDGNIFATDYENHRVVSRNPGGAITEVATFQSYMWPDTMSLSRNGYLYVMCNELQRQSRFHEGKDLRKKPYILYRVKVGSSPVMLK